MGESSQEIEKKMHFFNVEVIFPSYKIIFILSQTNWSCLSFILSLYLIKMSVLQDQMNNFMFVRKVKIKKEFVRF